MTSRVTVNGNATYRTDGQMLNTVDTLRPASWRDYYGQQGVKTELDVHIRAAVKFNEPLPHVLLLAAPGYGKTALASIVHARLNETRSEDFEILAQPIPNRELRRLITRVYGVLFLDELHTWPKARQMELLTLLEFGWMENRGRRAVAPWLTVVAASTEPQALIPPLVERFSIQPRFVDYTDEDLGEILGGMAGKAGVSFTSTDREKLAIACNGVPRRARHLVIAARSLGVTQSYPPTAEEILSFTQFTADGLSPDDLAYLKLLDEVGDPVGLDSICKILNCHPAVVQNQERLLFRRHLITFSPRGRELDTAGVQRLRQAS